MALVVGIIADSYTATAFDPLSIAWHSAFWASDPGWTPPSSGGAVSSWRNAGTSGAAAVQAGGTAQPTYEATYSSLNSNPAIVFDGSSDRLDAGTASIAQPNHLFAVGWLDPTAPTDPTITDSTVGSTRHILRNNGAGSSVVLYAGTVQTVASAGVDGPFALVVLFNGASSAARINGAALTIGGTVGTQNCGSLRIGGDNSAAATAYYKGALAFVGVKDTALTAGEISNLEAWAETTYGVSIP